ncbi:hypothetical protein QUA08_27455 [Microcoleus sp. T3B2]|uniref:hypothetical protein n=1 Tax=Microcoleus sp. T3B2 TaxID=3055426 RepID=UPI002FD50356
MPVPQKLNFLVEQAEKPVPKQLIENGATSQFNPISSGFVCLGAVSNRADF